MQALSLSTNGANVERCHQLTTVVGNLQVAGEYYRRVGLTCFKEIVGVEKGDEENEEKK